MQKAKQNDKPAVVIASFGSTRRGKVVLRSFRQEVAERFGEYDIFWAATSAVIRRKTGEPGVAEILLEVKSSGFKTAAILPLQIFPGVEYRKICEVASSSGELKVKVGETLMHRWRFIKEVLAVVSKDFISPEQGDNLLALHGTPMAADPANAAYLGLNDLVLAGYENVFTASLEGVPDHDAVLGKLTANIKDKNTRHIRILPLLLTAGMHVEKDLLGSENSWKRRLEDGGYSVDCPVVQYDGGEYFKSLIAYAEIREFFLQRLESCLHSFDLLG